MSATRVPSTERRQMLVEAGIEIARTQGGRAVTLARVAEACGVSKPIAYRLFDSLTDLLVHMERHVVAEYEAVVINSLANADTTEASRRQRLATVTSAYIHHGLGAGAVYDTVLAARIATEDASENFYEFPDAFLALARDHLGVPEGQEIPVLAMFQGAADYLVKAVEAGVLGADAAIDHLLALFAPYIDGGSGGAEAS